MRWGGNDNKHDFSDPYHEVSPVDNPEASNDFLDCPVKDMLGDKWNNMEGVVVGPGRDRNADRVRHKAEET